MFFIYILYSNKDSGLYIGFSRDLKARLERHQNGEVTSTKNRRPLQLIYYEAFVDLGDAMAREKYLKSGYGRKQLSDILKRTFTNILPK